MRTAKQRWIYQGLSVPLGSALVRKAQTSRQTSRVLVIGEPRFDCLRNTLPGVGGSNEFSFDFERDSLASRLRDDELDFSLAAFGPTDVFIAHDPSDAFARQAVRSKVRSYGARELWMVPPGVPWVANKNFCPAYDLTVEGVASWAARAVAMVS